MVTRHDGAPTSAERFDEYDRQVRREYRYVPQFVYRPKRRQVLESFLARGRIYTTAAYFDALEQQARANLTRAIDRLD
jgi:predicted metal-dependent HD superfamily phosphohydrolase